MDVARRAALLSYAQKRQVGCIAVYNGNILGYGFNGTPSGHSNRCEDDNGNTLSTVIHAEDNLIRKLTKTKLLDEEPTDLLLFDCDVYVNKFPCLNCANLLCDHGTSRVFYQDPDQLTEKYVQAYELLKTKGVKVLRL